MSQSQGTIQEGANEAGEPLDLDSHGRVGEATFLAVIAAVLAHRLYLLFAHDFPINDGALFGAFVDAAGSSFPRLPTTATYNGWDLPFAYPPVGFWVGGLLQRLGAPTIEILRVLPLVANMMCIVMLALLLRRLGMGPWVAAAAMAVFGVTVRSYEWLVMGGGLTRGIGALFFLACLLILFRGRQPMRLRGHAFLGIVVGLTMLAHLEWGVLAASTVLLHQVLNGSNVRSVLRGLVASGITALLCVGPWLVFTVSRHGVDPYLSASGTSGWGHGTLQRSVETLFMHGLNGLLVLGLIVLIRRRDWFWPFFMVLCLVATPRHAPTPLVFPVAVGTAVGLNAAVAVLRRRPAAPIAGLVISAVVLTCTTLLTNAEPSRWFRPLPQGARSAMAWVAENHTGDRFALVTRPQWSYDAAAEWFPYLTDSVSVTTVQGTEWRAVGEFEDRVLEVRALKAARTCEDMSIRLAAFAEYDYVWVESMRRCFLPADYRMIYSGSGIAVFQALEGRVR